MYYLTREGIVRLLRTGRSNVSVTAEVLEALRLLKSQNEGSLST
jgi:hypothetical protein